MTGEVVRDARLQARRACAEHDVTDRCDDVVLVVSELVGNAVRHGQPPVTLDLTYEDDELVVGVEDADPSPPASAAPSAAAAPPASPASGGDPAAGGVGGEELAESGRGMGIVAALSRVWGWHRTIRGKRVWARLSCGGPAR